MYDKSTIRLQKYLAHAGLGSRRGVETLIKSGQVIVNGQVAILGHKINPHTAVVKVNGKNIPSPFSPVYILLNKPPGVVSSRVSQDGSPIVTDYVATPIPVYPVGRLDKDSQGLILLTNDGELTHRLTHPKFHLPKTYHVLVGGQLTPQKISQLQSGIQLSDGVTDPCQVNHLPLYAPRHQHWLTIVLQQGKFRQIRRMCSAVNLTVHQLIRVKFGPLTLNKLSLGQTKSLTTHQVNQLKQVVGLQD